MNTSIKRTVLMLSALVLALPLAMDIYIPAVPTIARLFNISATAMQLTLTLFMVTAGFLQLVLGPLSDQHGRKKICMISIVIFAVGCILCAVSSSLYQLVISRLIQAVGCCGMLMIPFAIVRDLYSGVNSAKTYSLLNGIISFSPMFAPFIGSYIDVYFGWQSTFLALLIIALIGFLTLGFGLPETLNPAYRRKFNWQIFMTYKSIFCNQIFSIYTLFSAFGFSYFYLFCSISPYLIIRQLHIPELDYGYYFCFMGISFFLGSFLSAYAVGKLGIYQTVVLGFIISLLGGALMTGWYFITGLTINNFIWPMILIGIGGTFTLGASNGGAMEPFTKDTGAAAALGGGFRFVFSGVLGSIVISKHIASTLPLAMPAVIFSLLGIIVFIKMRSLLDLASVNENVSPVETY